MVSERNLVESVAPEFYLSVKLTENADFIPVRNVGGRAEFAIRDLLVLDTFVGVNDIMVVHHTGVSVFL